MKIITGFDYIGTKPSFYINGETSYKTTLGGLLSLMFTISILTGFCYFFNLLISKETFTVETSEEYYPDSFADWSKVDLSIFLLDKFGMPFRNQDRLYDVSSMWWKYEVDISTKNQNLGRGLKILPVKMETCNLTNFSVPSLRKNSITLNISKCVAPDQKLNITKSSGVPNSSIILFWVSRCVNSTTKKNCYPPEKIEQDLMNANAVIQFNDYFYDHKRTENIGLPYLYTDTPIVSSTNYRRVKYTMRETEYSEDNGLILPNVETTNYVTFSSLRETVDFRTDQLVPGAVLGISFDMNVLKQKVKKNYYKFQNMLADIGGLYKAMLTLITFFNGYFSDRYYLNEIIEKNIDSMSKKKCTSLIAPITILNNDPKFSNSKMLNLEQSQNNLMYLQKNKAYFNNKRYSSRQIEFFTPEKNRNTLNIISNIESNNTTPVKNNDVSTESYSKKNCPQIICPNWCFNSNSTSGKKLAMTGRFKKFMTDQLDIVKFFHNMNNFDKICIMLTGKENMKILDKCINPNICEEDIDAISEFRNVKTKIISNLSNIIMNFNEEIPI